MGWASLVKSDVTIDFSVNVTRTEVHPVTGILLDPVESEVRHLHMLK